MKIQFCHADEAAEDTGFQRFVSSAEAKIGSRPVRASGDLRGAGLDRLTEFVLPHRDRRVADVTKAGS